MDILQAKSALDNVIKKSRVHLYKPIQIAEILYRDRVHKDIDLADLGTFRNKSKKWRDEVSDWLLGRVCTSSARFQDDLFNDNAIPVKVLKVLGEENRRTHGAVEAYIYTCFSGKYFQLHRALKYCTDASLTNFKLEDLLDLFNAEPGLKRSIDKVYEIVVYALFSVIVEQLNVEIEIRSDLSKADLLKEFEDFTRMVIGIDSSKPTMVVSAKLFRVGATNAADRGLDIWANFGPVVQIKHLSLDEELAEDIVNSVSADRIIIVCKSGEKKLILSLLNQIGWRARIQSIITETDLICWYEKALKGNNKNILGKKLLLAVADEMKNEFPSTDGNQLLDFGTKRGYLSIDLKKTAFKK